MPLAVLPFKEKYSLPSAATSAVERAYEEERAHDVARRIAEIFEEVDALENAGTNEGSHIINERSFKLLQWAEKQLEIRRLQRESQVILSQIEEADGR